jgi:DNA invertase Pin-like site-specific DNA recombinase
VNRVAIYARVSTIEQSSEVQLHELREYCARRGWTVGSEYVDEGVSGTRSSRPQLDRLMAEASKRRFDTVLVWKFDRFARSVSHLLRALETFKAQGIDFVSFTEQMDTSTPAGKMIFTVLGAVGELERSLIIERVKAGLRNAKSRGIRLGAKRVNASAEEVRNLAATGLSQRSIAAQLRISAATVCRRMNQAQQNAS